MAHSVSHEPPTPTPPPLFSFLKTIQCLAVTFNLDSKYGTKDRLWCKQNYGVQFLNSPANLGRSPSSAIPEQRSFHEQAAGELIAEMHISTCNCLILTSGLQRKRSTICIFTFVSSSLKYKMHFMCLTRSFTNAREGMGNFTPLGCRKIEFYG